MRVQDRSLCSVSWDSFGNYELTQILHRLFFLILVGWNEGLCAAFNALGHPKDRRTDAAVRKSIGPEGTHLRDQQG
jgi:hypothetical protein